MRIRDILFSVVIFLLFAIAGKAQERVNKDSSDIKIELLPFNSSSNDFAAIPFGSGLLFCSERRNGLIPYYSEESGALLPRLFYIDSKSTGSWSSPTSFLREIHGKATLGPASFSSSGSTVYFTGSLVLEEELSLPSEKVKSKIYVADFIDKKWTNFRAFVHNNDKYAFGHPSLSHDGTQLYFASDMPGGYGGTDIYVCYLKNGKWTKPVNVGPKINTRKNELYPFISKENILYFSSDGLSGHGKFDLFYAKNLLDQWQNVKNLGEPFNSEFNDFAFSEDVSGFSGYFTSDRKTGSEDNLYRFEKLKPACDSASLFPYCYTFYEVGTLDDESLPLVYEWDFGDGNKKRGLEVDHCFQKPGSYIINLNILDSITGKVFFNEASYQLDVVTINKPHIETEGFLIPNSTVYFNGEKSHLNDCIINEYYWDFGDGKSNEGVEISHIFTKTGTYNVTLLVKGKSTASGTNCQACVERQINITTKQEIVSARKAVADPIETVAETLYDVKDQEDLVYKVQVGTSDTPIKIDSAFKDLENVAEYKHKDRYGYVVGEEKDLESAYPLYIDIKEKGYEDAHVVAFKNGKLISGEDTASFGKPAKAVSFTQISGRIMNRYGDPLGAEIILENLSTGKIIGKIVSDSIQGKFHIILPNEEMYGFYAELKGYYSVSNFIDLRGETRNLEIKKNIELIHLKELSEENLSIRINNLFFESNQYELVKESFPELTRLAKLIKDNPEIRIEISGHTDNTGDAQLNLKLSQKRADAVKDFLISQGVLPGNISASGYGDARPLVSNSTERGRYLNRRVEFRLFFK